MHAARTARPASVSLRLPYPRVENRFPIRRCWYFYFRCLQLAPCTPGGILSPPFPWRSADTLTFFWSEFVILRQGPAAPCDPKIVPVRGTPWRKRGFGPAYPRAVVFFLSQKKVSHGATGHRADLEL